MIPLTLAEVRDLAPGRLEGTAETITGIQIDSRRIGPGDLFVVVSRGEAFLDDARARGAAATLVPDDAHAALAALAGAVRARSDAQVVGITGSVGKTSTKDILAALAASAPAHRRGGGRLQQRARPAAHAVPDRARHRSRRDGDGDARGRSDPRPCTHRAAAHRRHHRDRSRPSRAAREPREHRAREGRAARGARAGRGRGSPGGCARARAVRAGRARRAALPRA